MLLQLGNPHWKILKASFQGGIMFNMECFRHIRGEKIS
jgi:hypothetical protein